jgi:hypothetical protein
MLERNEWKGGRENESTKESRLEGKGHLAKNPLPTLWIKYDWGAPQLGSQNECGNKSNATSEETKSTLGGINVEKEKMQRWVSRLKENKNERIGNWAKETSDKNGEKVRNMVE